MSQVEIVETFLKDNFVLKPWNVRPILKNEWTLLAETLIEELEIYRKEMDLETHANEQY